MKSTKDILTKLGACAEAVKWAGRKTPKKAWETCKQSDWLLWIAGKLNIDRKKLVLAACACARTALKYIPAGEDRPRIAIETAEAWTRGEATIEQVRTATHAAHAAAHAAYTAHSAYVADAAAQAAHSAYVADAAAQAAHSAYVAHAAYTAHAAYVADAAAHSAHSAYVADAAAQAAHSAYAADAATYAAYAAHAAHSSLAAQKQMADIVREIIPFNVIKQAIADYEGKA